MGKFATSGDGVHTSVHVSQLPGKASTRVATACARSQRVAKTVAPSCNVVHFCTIRPLVDEKTLPEVATSQHVAMTAVRPYPSVGTPSPQVGMPKNWHPVRRVLRHTPCLAFYEVRQGADVHSQLTRPKFGSGKPDLPHRLKGVVFARHPLRAKF